MLRKVVKKKTKVVKVVFNYEDKDKISKYHKILELTHPIKEGDVKRAFRRLSLLHHPDRGGNNQRFQEINEAYFTNPFLFYILYNIVRRRACCLAKVRRV